jgi:glycine betaine/proline transport system substrate-binding protein
MKRLFMLFIMLSLALPAFAAHHMPGDGVTVRPARATWNTGYFNEALVREALTELGYEVEKVKELANPLFYQSVTLGDLDYWANGWFPMHNDQTPKRFSERATPIGDLMKAGGLQGYLVSKSAVEKFNIKSLDDFKRDEVKKAFDSNGDGKADLIACPPGWGCEKIISHHMDVYGLEDHINPIKAGYSASMADGLARFNNGEPVFFYTWAPNWTIHKLKPGTDVMWINVPEINPTPAQKSATEQMVQSGITGAVSDPIKLGFVVADIRIVANKKFLKENPAAEKLFEIMKLDLADVNAQNTRMQEGEKSAEDIQRHVKEWIAENQETWNSWLEAARKAAM